MDDRDRRREERHEPDDHDVLESARVVLDTVDRIARAFEIVVGQRHTLHVAEQLRAEIAQHPLAGVGRQQ